MNALRLSIKSIKEMIAQAQYEVTGLLETGEITVALVSQTEKDMIEKLIIENATNDKAVSTLYKLSEIHGNNSRELIKTWEQLNLKRHWKPTTVCVKNGLQIKKFRDY